MIYTILSEPRSGSTNLLIWMRSELSLRNNFIIVGEPGNPNSLEYKGKLYDYGWVDLSKNYIINEKFYPGQDISQLLSISDKITCLYRENEKEQIESYVMALVTKNWVFPYQAQKFILDKIDNEYSFNKTYFKGLKDEFKKFREIHNLKSFSYEELYYGNKINEFKEFFNFKIDIPFPLGEKYRRAMKIDKLI